jgi:hypothetical protein
VVPLGQPSKTGLLSIGPSSLLFAAAGYLLLWNEKFQDFLRIKFDTHYSPWPLWRIWMIYYGATCVAVATGLYSYFCPKAIKDHATAFEVARNEAQHLAMMGLGHTYLNDVKMLEANCTVAERKLWPPDRPKDDFILQMRGREEEPPALASLIVYAWRVYNIKHPRLRLFIRFMYSLGFVLLAIPAIWTFVQVTHFALRHLIDVLAK